MSVTTRRRLTMLDALILIAALAGGLGVVRASRVSFAMQMARDRQSTGGMMGFIESIRETLATLAGLALGVFALSWRERRERVDTPGWIAVSAILASVAFSIVHRAPDQIPPIGNPPLRLFAAISYLLHPWGVGTVVFSAWAVQSISGRWCPIRDWLDLAGRVVGFLVIATSLFASWYARFGYP